ncbi:unnamed protein product [Caenorhabditis bovis]|uniref:Uncharacterized protein n=1 Tax=Caenorhabditis bovis TaxID=2654633 RepID=A0A8S1ERE5_9PELO|nr:unnamed protein product [Caenorhabditis bovis]
MTTESYLKPRAKIRRTHYVDLNKLVWKYFKECQEAGVTLNGKNLKDQAMRYAKYLGLDTFRGSEGWLDAFKRRHRIDLRLMTGQPVAYENEFCEMDGEMDTGEASSAGSPLASDMQPTSSSSLMESLAAAAAAAAAASTPPTEQATANFTDIKPLDIAGLMSAPQQQQQQQQPPTPVRPIPQSIPNPMIMFDNIMKAKTPESNPVLDIVRSCSLRHPNKEVQYALDILRCYVLSKDANSMGMIVQLQEALAAVRMNDLINWGPREDIARECAICQAPSNGYHFNAPSCSACAAFFRRTVTLNRNFLCAHHGSCQVNFTMRVICRACRYRKCIQMGMERAAVQPRRDCNAGRRKIMYQDAKRRSHKCISKPSSSLNSEFPNFVNQNEHSDQSPEIHYAQSYSSSISEDNPSPKISIPFNKDFEVEQLLDDLLREERLFNERRKLLYCSHSSISKLLITENVNDIPFSEHDIQPLSFTSIQKHIRPQILLIYEWLRGWKHFDMLNTHDRLIFLRRCVLYHTILDPSYISYRIGLPQKYIMFDGTFVSAVEGDNTGWHDENGCISSELKKKLYRPLMLRAINEICAPMSAMSMSFVEFVILKALACFKSASSLDISPNVKKFMDTHLDQLLKALNLHYQSLNLAKGEIAQRTGNVILMLSSIFAVGMECQESHQKIQFFDLWQLDDLLIKLISPA